MVICIFCYRVLDNRCTLPPKLLEKYPVTHDFGFEIHDPKNWYNYLREKYSGLKDEKNNLPVCFRVIKFGGGGGFDRDGNPGGSIYSYFPGYGKDGKALKPSEYGRID